MRKTKAVTQLAFTLIEIMIVVALIGLLAAIAVPNYLKIRTRAATNACINNLRLIDASKQQWALENRQPGSAVPVIGEIADYLIRANSTRLPVCPVNMSTNFSDNYDIRQVTNSPTCKKVPADHRLSF
jgi:prepilin-type N-terminal cleavage/methylation domain-containing protein